MACANCAFCEYTGGCINISFWGLPTNSVHVLRAINLGLEPEAGVSVPDCLKIPALYCM